jgi:hypothetical protein
MAFSYPLNEFFSACHSGNLFCSVIINSTAFELTIVNPSRETKYQFGNISFRQYVKMLELFVDLGKLNELLNKIKIKVRHRNCLKFTSYLIDEALEILDTAQNWIENVSIFSFMVQLELDVEHLKHDLYTSINPAAFENLHLQPILDRVVVMRRCCRLFLDFFACDQEKRPNYYWTVRHICSRI